MQNNCNFDLLAIGCRFIIGNEIFKKVSPMISENVSTGELLYDARIMGYPKAEPPMVMWIR